MQQEEGRWSSSHCHGVALTRDSFSLKIQGGTPEDTKTASVPQGVLLGLEGQPPGPKQISSARREKCPNSDAMPGRQNVTAHIFLGSFQSASPSEGQF